MKLLKNENGVALFTVVLAMAVSIILGSAVLSFALSDTRLATNQEHHLQAEYIARAGADAAAQYVQKYPSSFPSDGFPDRTVGDSLGEGSFSAVIKPSSGAVLITSTGTVSGTTAIVNLKLSKESYSSLFNGVRQTAPDTELDLSALAISYEGSQVMIEGHVEDPETDIKLSTNNPNNAGDTNITKAANYDPPGTIVLPLNYTSFTGTAESVGQITTITGDVYLHSLTKGNNETIVFDTQGRTQTVVVDTLDFGGSHGTVDIINGGVVQLYIRNSGSIDNPVNVNSDGTTKDPAQLFIYVCDGKTLSLQSGCQLSAYIAAPNATIELQSDHTTVNGAMVGNIIQRNDSGNGPHGEFHYVPLPESVDHPGYLAYAQAYYYGN